MIAQLQGARQRDNRSSSRKLGKEVEGGGGAMVEVLLLHVHKSPHARWHGILKVSC